MATSTFPTDEPEPQRRRRKHEEDPFPLVSTTETPLIPTADLVTTDDETEVLFTPPTFVSGRHSSTASPKSLTPLRPAQDILNRLIWDKSLRHQPSTVQIESPAEKDEDLNDKDVVTNGFEHLIGYLDRFTGVQQVTLDEWIERRKDRDGEEWVPLHRVMWVKRRKRRENEGKGMDHSLQKTGEEEMDANERDEEPTEVVIWDRVERIDLIFHSGNSCHAIQEKNVHSDER